MRRYFAYTKFNGGYTPLSVTTAAALLKAQGARYRAGGYRRRPGTLQLGDNAITSPSGARGRMLAANFYDGIDIYCTYPDALYRYNAGTDHWDSVALTNFTLPTAKINAWSGCMLYDDFWLTQGLRFTVSSVLTNDGIVKISSAGGAVSRVTNSPAGRDIIAYGNRLFVLYVHDADGNIFPYRLRFSDVGNPSDWYVNGGYADIADDGYPLARGIVLGGRLMIFKGNEVGGSLIQCTATSSTAFPLVFETVFGLGILGPQTLTRCGRDAAFFLSHDGAYVMQGSAPPEAVTDFALAQEILESIDLANYDRAFSYYDALNGEVTLSLPTGDGMVAYTYNFRAKVWTGPEPLPLLTSACYGQKTVVESWDSSPVGDTWDGDDTTWDESAETRAAPAIMLSRTDGKVALHSTLTTSDLGDPITLQLVTGDEDMNNEPFVSGMGRERRLTYANGADFKVADAVVVRWKDLGSWTGLIEVSADTGSTWQTVYNGTFTGNGSEGARETHLHFPQLVGPRFRVRLTASGIDHVEIVGVMLGASHVSQPQ